MERKLEIKQKVVFIVAAAMAVLCALLLIPTVQNLIILMMEKFVVHRLLEDHGKWIVIISSLGILALPSAMFFCLFLILKMKKKITLTNVFIILTIAVLFSCLLLFCRKPYNRNVIESASINSDNKISNFISINDNKIFYNNIAGKETFDFNKSKNAFYCDLGRLPFGFYKIYVNYLTTYDSSNIESPITKIHISGNCKVNDLFLYNYKTMVVNPFLITSTKGTDITLDVYFTDYGSTSIDSLIVKECISWKLMFLIVMLLIIWGIYFLYAKFQVWGFEKRFYFFAMLLLVLFSSLPAMCGKSFSLIGHDWGFHLPRIAAISNELSYGNFPVLYQSDAWNGFGYITPLMYGQIFLYIPAILHLWGGVSLSFVYDFYIILTNISTCLICWYSFKGVFKNKKYAFLGTVIYMLAAYRMTNLYLRSATGEFTAMTFLPLIVYGFYKIYFSYENVSFKDTLPLVLGITGVIESHTLSTEMLIPFVFAIAIIHIKITAKNIVLLLKAAITIVALNLFFIIPFLQSYKQPLIINSNEYSANLLSTGTFFPQQVSMFMTYTGENVGWGMKNEMPITLGFSIVIGGILFLTICFFRKDFNLNDNENKKFKIALECFFYAILSTWFSSIYFPWDFFAGKRNFIFKAFTSIQFAWRYLSLATVFFTFLSVYAVKFLYGNTANIKIVNFYHNKKIGFAVIAVAFLVYGHFISNFINEANLGSWYSCVNNIGNDALYLPQNMDKKFLSNATVHIDNNEKGIVKLIQATQKNDGKKYFRIENPDSECVCSFPVVFYDYLEVVDENRQQFETFKGFNQQLAIKIPSDYHGTVKIGYKFSVLWKIAYIISTITAITLILYTIILKKVARNE